MEDAMKKCLMSVLIVLLTASISTAQEKRSSMKFEGTLLKDVVEMLADDLGVALEASLDGKTYTGTPTGSLKQKLEQVLSPHGLRAEIVDFVVYIKSGQRRPGNTYNSNPATPAPYGITSENPVLGQLAATWGIAPSGYGSGYGYGQYGYLDYEQIRKRQERQFQTEGEWGSFKIKEIPSGMARRIQVFAKLPGGQYKYVTGADTANNWYEKSQPIPVDIEALAFVFISAGLIQSVELPILVPPSYVKDGRVEITLTRNQFENAREATWLRHRRKVESENGTFVEIVSSDSGGWKSSPDRK